MLFLKTARLYAWPDTTVSARWTGHKTRQQTCTHRVEGRPEYNGESRSNRRILMRDKWSYCVLLKGLEETGGACLSLRRRALNGITGRGSRNTSTLSFFRSVTVLWSHFFKTSVCSCPLFLSSSLTRCLRHIYHHILPAPAAAHPSPLACHTHWFNVLSQASHRINLC